MAISLLDALQITEDIRKPFSISFVSFNKTKRQGGKIIKLSRAVRVGATHNMKQNDTINVKQLGPDNHPIPVHTHLILTLNDQEIFI